MAESRQRPGICGGVTAILTVLGALLLGVSAQSEVKLKVGDKVTLVPQYTGDPSEINWKINGNKVVDMELSPLDVVFYRLQDRATISHTNGVLTIRDLTIGDSGFYRAEVPVNGVYQTTEIRLTVLDYPAQPNITDISTKEKIVLFCNSSSKDVTYLWQKNGETVGKNQLYTEPRSNMDVTLTCVVLNEVSNRTAYITIHRTPEPSDPSGWVIPLVIILLVLILVGIVLLYHYRNEPCVDKVYNALTCNKTRCMENAFKVIYIGFTCGKGTKIDPDENKPNGTNKPDNKEDVPLIPGGVKGAKGDVGEGNAVDKKAEGVKGAKGDVQEGNAVEKKAEESDCCGSIALNLPREETMRLVKFKKDNGPAIEVEMNEVKGRPERIVKLFVTIEGVSPADYGDYAAEARLSNGEKRLFPIKGDECEVEYENAVAAVDEKVEGKDDVVIIALKGGRVTLTVPDTEKVTMLAWKKGDVILFEWTVSGLELHANNITLVPGSAIVNNLEPGDSGSYNVEVHSANYVTTDTLQLEVVKQVDKSEKRRIVKLKVVRKGDLPENGHPESQLIGSITFHPIKMIGKTSITWKKDDQLVDMNDKRIKLGPNGDLTINNVTPEDLGKYTVHCEDQKLEQEFILH